MADAAADSVPVERRKAARERTLRHALFTALTGAGRLQEGTVTDISCLGLGIHTRRPAPQGERVDIEMHGRGGALGGGGMMLRGRVARVEDLGGGEYAMGVHLTAKSPRPHAMHATPVPRAWGTASVRIAAPATRRARAARQGDGKAARRAAYTALALMFLIFLLLCWQTAQPVHGQTGAYAGVRVAAAAEVLPEPAPNQKPSGPAAGLVESAPRRQTPRVAPVGAPLRVDTAAESAAPPRAEGGRDGEPGPRDVLVGTLAPELEPVSGEPAVLSIVVSELPRPGERDAPGRGEGGAEPDLTLAAFRGDSPDPRHGLPFDGGPRRSLPRGPALQGDIQGAGTDVAGLPADAAASERWAEAEGWPVFVLVETSQFMLTVFVQGSPVRQFRVGIGRDGATPEGFFRIGTKLSDPDWYNHGNVVPAGDPGNPLGKRWLGLHGQGRPTSYGIHPTRDASSIGRPMSLGCVRMRPDDAETLFRLCPVGTPVRVCE